MAFEIITLNLIPDGEMPVFHASQFDTARPVIIDLVMGEDAYVVPEGITLELHCRKVDDTIVTMEPDEVTGNRATFVTTEQLTACIGDNLCEVALLNGDDHIGTLNFILHVEPDPLAGGLTSESDICNLTQQIEDIAEEVIGEDYYDKTEVDALLADKADVSDLPDMSNYYTKSQVYNKTETDTFLADKADVSDLPDMSNYYTKSQVYNKSEVDSIIDNIFPTLSASGTIASFTTALNKPLVSVTTEEGATTVTRCGANFTDISDNTISGAGYVIGGFPVAINSDNSILPIGDYVFSFDIQNATYPCACQLIWYRNGVEVGNTVVTINASGIDAIAFTASGEFDGFVMFCNSSSGGAFTNFNLNIGSTPLEYEAYTSDTVPVAGAMTLETLAGTNNVYADIGDVTVQYKYMSM